jgi:hypothetical protein
MQEGMSRLRFMRGDWNVSADVMGEDGRWMKTPLPNETSISAIFSGSCHYEEMPVSYGDLTINLFFSWSYDKYRKVYRMISCDHISGLMSVMEGNFIEDTDTVVVSSVRAGTSMIEADGTEVFSRLSSTKTGEDSFMDIVEESLDDGQTWSPVFRAKHTRKSL